MPVFDSHAKKSSRDSKRGERRGPENHEIVNTQFAICCTQWCLATRQTRLLLCHLDPGLSIARIYVDDHELRRRNNVNYRCPRAGRRAAVRGMTATVWMVIGSE